jgi:hypothetical protein
MSKPIARVVFAVLISLVIIGAAASPFVQSRFGSVFQRTGASSSAITSMFTDKQTLEQPSQFDEFSPDSSHGCNSDPSVDY